MSNVRVIADTTACIPPDLAAKYKIKIVPAANIIIDGRTHIENVTITIKEAYDLIRKDPDKFITSAITPGLVVEAFQELSRETDQILFFTISSKLSAVYKSAGVAAELFKEQSPKTNIKIIDSRSVAGGEGLPALAAAQAAAQGMSLEQVTTIAEKYRELTKCLMTMDTLRYIYRTGRMSKFSARLASLFNIRPINLVTESGTIEMVDKTRSREEVMKHLVTIIKSKTSGERLNFMISHGDAPEMAGKLAGLLKQNFQVQDILITDYSPVMGYGGGPGAMCIAFHPELKLF